MEQVEFEEIKTEAKTVRVLLQTATILVENLPPNFSRLMLDELVKSYPGVERIVEMDGAGCRAVIGFDSSDSAKFAVMGLNRFIVDQSGRQLAVSFVPEE